MHFLSMKLQNVAFGPLLLLNIYMCAVTIHIEKRIIVKPILSFHSESKIQ